LLQKRLDKFEIYGIILKLNRNSPIQKLQQLILKQLYKPALGQIYESMLKQQQIKHQ